jgi:MHS family metabolite:H+ symporter-like MFS transporter
MLGPQCAMLPEMFGNKHRYLGVAVSREFSAVIAGGLAGVLGAALIKWFDGSWVPLAVYTFVLAGITFATTFITAETRGRDLIRVDDAHDEVKAGGVAAR